MSRLNKWKLKTNLQQMINYSAYFRPTTRSLWTCLDQTVKSLSASSTVFQVHFLKPLLINHNHKGSRLMFKIKLWIRRSEWNLKSRNLWALKSLHVTQSPCPEGNSCSAFSPATPATLCARGCRRGWSTSPAPPSPASSPPAPTSSPTGISWCSTWRRCTGSTQAALPERLSVGWGGRAPVEEGDLLCSPATSVVRSAATRARWVVTWETTVARTGRPARYAARSFVTRWALTDIHAVKRKAIPIGELWKTSPDAQTHFVKFLALVILLIAWSGCKFSHQVAPLTLLHWQGLRYWLYQLGSSSARVTSI